MSERASDGKQEENGSDVGYCTDGEGDRCEMIGLGLEPRQEKGGGDQCS
jgi:hypothetical protein